MKLAVFVISFTASHLTVLLTGLFAASLQGWFGISDLTFLATWFLPLGLLAGALSAFAAPAARRWSLAIRFILGLVLGLALGFLWTFAVASFLGPWWGAVSLPALMCWMAGAVSGVAGGLVLGPGSSPRSRVVSAVVLLALAVAGVVLSKPLATQLAHDQTLAVRFLRWTPGSSPLTIESEREDALSEAQLALIRATKPNGTILVLWGGSTHGRGPSATALVLLERPLGTRVVLRQPDRTTALYVQSDEDFLLYPPSARTLDREITLSPLEDGVWCSVRIASGGVQSGPFRVW